VTSYLVRRNPRERIEMIQTSAITKVIRLRFFSAAAEPRPAPLPPPNISDRPPPLPLCIKIVPTMANMETTLTKTIMYITMSRTVGQPSGFSRGNGRPLDDLVPGQSTSAPEKSRCPELWGNGYGIGNLMAGSLDSERRRSK